MLEEKFSTYFGLLEEDVVEIVKYYGIEHEIDDIKRWYNGYVFGKNIIYNPWSIIKFAESHEEGLRAYWVNTSGNDLIKKLITSSGSETKSDIEKLISGASIKKTITDDVVSEDLDNDDNALWSFLLFTGYLKSVSSEYANKRLICDLMIPNIEVEYFYENTILSWFQKSTSSSKMRAMLEALIEGEIDVFEYYFREFVISTMSYFDPTGEEPERVYQAFVMGMLLNLSDNYIVKSNRESGLGRYDVTIMPKDKKKKAFIFEFKKVDLARKQTLETALEIALAQIEEKRYDVELINEGMKPGVILMLYAFGDIHGMYDTLKTAISSIIAKKGDKFIFLGDYIDYGPSSKEVLDFLIDFDTPAEKIFLLGNHEQMMLDYLSYGPLTHKFNTHTWIQDNGGFETIRSFNNDAELYQKLIEIKYGYNDSKYKIPVVDINILGDKYVDFLKNLKTYHIEEVEDYKFLFSHAPFYYIPKEEENSYRDKADEDFLELQLSFKNYKDYQNAYQNEVIYSSSNNNLWNRDVMYKIKDYIMVTGHTPCCLFDKYNKDFCSETGYKPQSLVPFIKFNEKEIRVKKSDNTILSFAKLDQVSLINIDTGARYGEYLTVLTIDENKLNKQKRKEKFPHQYSQGLDILIEARQYLPYQVIKRDEQYNMPYLDKNSRLLELWFKE